jgi:hypothetical protein
LIRGHADHLILNRRARVDRMCCAATSFKIIRSV